MAAITPLQLLQPPPTAVKPFVLLSKLHRSSVFSNSILCSARLRKLSFSPPLYSNSDSIPKGSLSSGLSPSIVGDLLDYLNESWIHFHATGILSKLSNVSAGCKSTLGKSKPTTKLLLGINHFSRVQINTSQQHFYKGRFRHQ